MKAQDSPEQTILHPLAPSRGQQGTILSYAWTISSAFGALLEQHWSNISPSWPNLSRLWAILERWFSSFFRWDVFGDPLAPHLRNPDEAKTGIERDWWNRYWTWKVIFRPCERWISCLFFWLLCSTPTWLNFYYVQEPEPTCILFQGLTRPLRPYKALYLRAL